MIIHAVTQIGSPVIRKRARLVTKITSPGTKRVIRNLVDSMRAHSLVGMAAPQIGEGLRIFVTEVRRTGLRKKVSEIDSVRVFINPRVIRFSKKHVAAYEGCGSVAKAHLFGKVRRPTSVTMQAFDATGKSFTFSADGLLARVMQHELDHLNGMVFLDRMSDMKSLLDREHYLRLP